MSDEVVAPVTPVEATPVVATPEVQTEVQTTPVADAKVVPAGVPDKYEFKAPEGFEDRFDAAAAAAVEKEARALGLTQEAAQSYLNAMAERAKNEDTARETAWKTTQEGWISEVKADPKLGGTNFDKTQSQLKAVIEKFGDQAAKDFFDTTGAGNHPALCRMLAGIGAAMEQDTFVSASKPSTGDEGNSWIPGSKRV